ncbi:MAG: T9SS type A sorting domain-containing protein, partial [Pedobacter sp.]
NYYKLQQVDFNGEVKELGIRIVDFKLGSSISVYPNPVVEKATITFTAGYQSIELLNINGRILQKINISKGETRKEISLANYSLAIYFIKLVGINKTDIRKLIKQ